MSHAGSAFADEMSKIANAKLRVAELLGGAALGAGVAGLAGGKNSEKEALLAGAALGAGAAGVVSRVGINRSALKRVREFMTTKKFQSSAEMLAEGSDFLSRPHQLRQQLRGLNPAEAGNLTRGLQNILDYVPGQLKKQQRRLDIQHKELAALMSQKSTAAQMRAWDEVAKFEGEIADLRRWPNGLNDTQRRVRQLENMLSKAKTESGKIQGRRNLIFSRQRTLEAEEKAAEKAIKDHREAHKKLMEEVREGAFQEARNRILGVI